MKDQVRDQLDAIIDETADAVGRQTDRIRELGDRLERDLPAGARLAGNVADQVDGRLDELDADRVVTEATALAHRRGPWPFVAGGAAAGFLLWVALRRSEDAPEQEEPTREARGRLEAGS